MAKVIGIMGESGSGKTTSMQNLDPKTTFYIDADKNIFNTISNVKLDKIIKYYKDKAPYDFLDKY